MKLDKQDYSMYSNLAKLKRSYSRQVDEIIEFCREGLQNPLYTYRADYEELLQLTILFLGGTLDKVVTIKAPGSISHARWMAKLIYSLKIALFRDQLKGIFDQSLLTSITELALFYCVNYTKQWFTAPAPFDAPTNDLQLYNKLRLQITDKSLSAEQRTLTKAVLDKLHLHLWYLSERLVILSLFSESVDHAEKAAMCQCLKKHNEFFTDATKMEQEMPSLESSRNVKLRDLVGRGSWAIFRLIGRYPIFIEVHPKDWSDDECFNMYKTLLLNLKVTNDAAERALGLVTEFHKSVVTCDLEQNHHLYRITKDIRFKQAQGVAKGKERRTKRNIKSLNYLD